MGVLGLVGSAGFCLSAMTTVSGPSLPDALFTQTLAINSVGTPLGTQVKSRRFNKAASRSAHVTRASQPISESTEVLNPLVTADLLEENASNLDAKWSNIWTGATVFISAVISAMLVLFAKPLSGRSMALCIHTLQPLFNIHYLLILP